MPPCKCVVPYAAPNRMPAPRNPSWGFAGCAGALSDYGARPRAGSGPVLNDVFRSNFAVPIPTRGNPPRLTAVGFGNLGWSRRDYWTDPRIQLFTDYSSWAGSVAGRAIGLSVLRDIWTGAAIAGHFPAWSGNESDIHTAIDGTSVDTPATLANVWNAANNAGVRDAKRLVDQYFYPAQQRYGSHWVFVTDDIGRQLIYDVADAWLAQRKPSSIPYVASAEVASLTEVGSGHAGPSAAVMPLRAAFPTKASMMGLGRLVGGGPGLGRLGASVSTSGAQQGVSWGASGAAVAGPIGFAIGAIAGYLVGSKNYFNVNTANSEEDQDVLDLWPQYQRIAGTVAGRDIGLTMLERVWRGAVYSKSDFTLNSGAQCFHNGCLKYPGDPGWIHGAIYGGAGTGNFTFPAAISQAASLDPRVIAQRFITNNQSDNPPWAIPRTASGNQLLIDIADALVSQKGAPYTYGTPPSSAATPVAATRTSTDPAGYQTLNPTGYQGGPLYVAVTDAGKANQTIPTYGYVNGVLQQIGTFFNAGAQSQLNPQPIAPATPTITPPVPGPIATGDATDQQLASQGYTRVGTAYANYPSNNAPLRLYQQSGTSNLFVLSATGLVPYGSPAQLASTGNAGPTPISTPVTGLDPATQALIQQYIAQGLSAQQASIGAQSYLAQQGVPMTPDVQAQVNAAATRAAGVSGGGALGIVAVIGGVLALMFATAHPRGGPAAVGAK